MATRLSICRRELIRLLFALPCRLILPVAIRRGTMLQHGMERRPMAAQMVTIYHNPKCSKSRETLALIEARGVTPKVVLYLDTPPSAKELDSLVTLLGVAPEAIVRTKEDLFKDLGLKGKTLS